MCEFCMCVKVCLWFLCGGFNDLEEFVVVFVGYRVDVWDFER